MSFHPAWRAVAGTAAGTVAAGDKASGRDHRGSSWAGLADRLGSRGSRAGPGVGIRVAEGGIPEAGNPGSQGEGEKPQGDCIPDDG